MSTDEIKDIQYGDLARQYEALHREYREALGRLTAMTDDFTDGSQQRFMNAMREVNALRDELWYTDQKIARMDAEQ